MVDLEQLSAINISLLTERRRVRFFSVFLSLNAKEENQTTRYSCVGR